MPLVHISRPIQVHFFAASLVVLFGASSWAAELVQLTPQNWDEFAPAGKEVDCIYGDYVLRNDRIVAVVAQPRADRHANLTVHHVGGAVIDLSLRSDGDKPAGDVREVDGTLGAWETNDQLSAFYPHAGAFRWQMAEQPSQNGEAQEASLRLVGVPVERSVVGDVDALQIELAYKLRDGDDVLTVESKIKNQAQQASTFALEDSIRVDGEFESNFDEGLGVFTTHDSYWGQAYGIAPANEGLQVGKSNSPSGRTGLRLFYQPVGGASDSGGEKISIDGEDIFVLNRCVFPGPHLAGVVETARRLAGQELVESTFDVVDAHGPVSHALVSLTDADGAAYASGRTDQRGRLELALPPGKYTIAAHSPAHRTRKLAIDASNSAAHRVELDQPGQVVAKIVDEQGGPIPCKVEFRGRGETEDPNFGPDSAVHGVRNLYYSPSGEFRIGLIPGDYDVVVSHGPEFDAIQTTISVNAGVETPLEGTLIRSVDTADWISSDFHSHASPSGDNTASQRGRVLNLLAEHIEFAPCTEHNRISSYVPHLQFFGLEAAMATCPGIELTGSPLPLNHQNAFPLVHKPRTQDGGGPVTDVNPIVQIERLAMWDDGSDKLVQTNHPNIVQMLGDKDQDGQADGGFEPMFHTMDVIEVHPPGDILVKPDALPANAREPGNVIFNWLQLLNLGYRIPGVVNTDAHWNFHGSGWLRNYIQCSTDDPGQASIDELVDAAEAGRMVMSNGPFLEVTAVDASNPERPAGPGDDIAAATGDVRLHIRVQCPNWFAVNRVQVLINGRPASSLNWTARSDRKKFNSGPLVFDESVELTLEKDAHLIVVAAGEGEQLGVVAGPAAGETMPVAVANPIFVDVDGGGFQANGDMLDLPLPIEEPQ